MTLLFLVTCPLIKINSKNVFQNVENMGYLQARVDQFWQKIESIIVFFQKVQDSLGKYNC